APPCSRQARWERLCVYRAVELRGSGGADRPHRLPQTSESSQPRRPAPENTPSVDDPGVALLALVRTSKIRGCASNAQTLHGSSDDAQGLSSFLVSRLKSSRTLA